MLAHINQFGSTLYADKCSLNNRLGFTDKCHHRTVCRLARVYIEKFYIGSSLYCCGNLRDYLLVATLAEVGHALYHTFFHIEKL